MVELFAQKAVMELFTQKAVSCGVIRTEGIGGVIRTEGGGGFIRTKDCYPAVTEWIRIRSLHSLVLKIATWRSVTSD